MDKHYLNYIKYKNKYINKKNDFAYKFLRNSNLKSKNNYNNKMYNIKLLKKVLKDTEYKNISDNDLIKLSKNLYIFNKKLNKTIYNVLNNKKTEDIYDIDKNKLKREILLNGGAKLFKAISTVNKLSNAADKAANTMDKANMAMQQGQQVMQQGQQVMQQGQQVMQQGQQMGNQVMQTGQQFGNQVMQTGQMANQMMQPTGGLTATFNHELNSTLKAHDTLQSTDSTMADVNKLIQSHHLKQNIDTLKGQKRERLMKEAKQRANMASGVGPAVAQVAVAQAAQAVPPMTTIDWVQLVLDICGMVPGVGIPLDLASMCIALYKGDMMDACLSYINMIPVIGSCVGTPIKMYNKWAMISEGLR